MSRSTTLPDDWLPLLASAGSVSALRDALGFQSSSALWKFAHGRTSPHGAVLVLLNMFCVQHRLDVPHV